MPNHSRPSIDQPSPRRPPHRLHPSCRRSAALPSATDDSCGRSSSDSRARRAQKMQRRPDSPTSNCVALGDACCRCRRCSPTPERSNPIATRPTRCPTIWACVPLPSRSRPSRRSGKSWLSHCAEPSSVEARSERASHDLALAAQARRLPDARGLPLGRLARRLGGREQRRTPHRRDRRGTCAARVQRRGASVDRRLDAAVERRRSIRRLARGASEGRAAHRRQSSTDSSRAASLAPPCAWSSRGRAQSCRQPSRHADRPKRIPSPSP